MVAEPGELADKFLQSVKFSLLSMMRGRRRKYASVITDISTVADLVRCRPCFQIGGVVHRYIGRQTQVCADVMSAIMNLLLIKGVHEFPIFCLLKVMEDDQEIGAYMFRRTVPSMHLTSEDIRWMVLPSEHLCDSVLHLFFIARFLCVRRNLSLPNDVIWLASFD